MHQITAMAETRNSAFGAARIKIIVLLICLHFVFAALSGNHFAHASAVSGLNVAEQEATGDESESINNPIMESIDQQVLVISGQSYSSEMNPVFAIKYPNIIVKFNNNANTVDQLLLDITTNYAAADIYVLNLSSGLFNAARKKGIALDLSTSPELSDFSDRMVSFIRDEIQDDKGLYGIPYTAQSRQIFAFNKSIAKELGISQPKSLRELATIYADWPTRNDVGDYFLTSMPLWNAFNRFLIYGIDSYIVENNVDGYISFDTDEFRKYISELEQLREPLSMLNDEHSGWKEHIHDRSLFVEQYPLLKTQEDIGIQTDNLVPIAMSFSDDASPVIPVDLSVFMINAASEKKDIAIDYLECLVQNYPPEQRIIFDDSFREPIEQVYYLENKTAYTREMNHLKESLLAPENKEKKLLIENEISKVSQILDEIESDRWKITAEDISGYDAIKQYICLLPRISYEYYDSIPSTKLLFFKFVNGETSANMFVDSLSHVQHLINVESQ